MARAQCGSPRATWRGHARDLALDVLHDLLEGGGARRPRPGAAELGEAVQRGDVVHLVELRQAALCETDDVLRRERLRAPPADVHNTMAFGGPTTCGGALWSGGMKRPDRLRFDSDRRGRQSFPARTRNSMLHHTHQINKERGGKERKGKGRERDGLKKKVGASLPKPHGLSPKHGEDNTEHSRPPHYGYHDFVQPAFVQQCCSQVCPCAACVQRHQAQ